MGTLLDQATANNAKITAAIAGVQASLSGMSETIGKALLATPEVLGEIRASLVRDAQKPGGKPVPLAMVDQVLAAEGVDLSDRFAIKEKMILRGQVRR